MSTRRTRAAVLAGSAALAVMAFAPSSASATPTGEQVHYTVVAENGVSAADAAAAITRAGGTIVSRNDDVGMFSVQATSAFAQAAIDAPELIGAATDRAIGQVPDAAAVRDAVEEEGATAAAGGNGAPVAAVRRRPARQPAVGHGDGARRRRPREAMGAGGSRSASSTAASTRATRISRPTSTWPVPQLHTRQAGHRRAV